MHTSRITQRCSAPRRKHVGICARLRRDPAKAAAPESTSTEALPRRKRRKARCRSGAAKRSTREGVSATKRCAACCIATSECSKWCCATTTTTTTKHTAPATAAAVVPKCVSATTCKGRESAPAAACSALSERSKRAARRRRRLRRLRKTAASKAAKPSPAHLRCLAKRAAKLSRLTEAACRHPTLLCTPKAATQLCWLAKAACHAATQRARDGRGLAEASAGGACSLAKRANACRLAKSAACLPEEAAATCCLPERTATSAASHLAKRAVATLAERLRCR